MDYQKLDPRAVKMWRVGRVIGLIALLAIGGVSLFILLNNLRGRQLLDFLPFFILGWTVPVLLQLLNLLLYPPIEYRQWAYLVSDDRIEIKKGIFFHSTRIIPISRIQHVMLFEGPLARHYHLASVTIHTAGGAMKIEGLARETAEAICEKLKTVVNRKARFEPGQAGG